MIIQKEVLVTKTNRNKSYYELKGYKTNDDNKYLVNVSDLPKSSHALIEVLCDECGIKKNVSYKNLQQITSNLKEKYYCEKCKHIKIKLSNINKYGVSTSFLREDVKKKIKKSLIDKYGVNHPMKSTFIKNKMKMNLLNKYDNDNVSKIESVKKKKNDTLKKTWINRLSEHYTFLNIIDGDYDKRKLKIQCDLNLKHNFQIDLNLLHNRIEFKNILCTICNPLHSNKSSYENLIYDFIKNNFDGEILTNNRKIISPYELDIYLPSLKIGIDFNGLHWHNELYKNKEYHKIKSDLCLKKGIQLIYIWEDDWINKQDIVKSILMNKLGKTSNKIFARKCEIKEINNNEIIRYFLNSNHIQGFIGSKIKIGLFYNDELISLMTFRKLRKNMNYKSEKDVYEMLRFCNKLDIIIIGGASKLFKYFIKKYEPLKVITYADRSFSNGNLYEQIGFDKIYYIKPNYYYILNHKRIYRFNFRKKVLVKEGYDSNKTEHEIMLERKIYRIYDSGSIKFEYKKKD